MSLLIDGQLQDGWLDSETKGGTFVRWESRFRHWVTSDGRPGPTGDGGFAAEPGRYHLYVSYACPWAHRTLIFRELKGLQDAISLSVVHPLMGPSGWEFRDYPGATRDEVNDARFMHEVYTRADPGYTGIVTVPVLWDKQQRTIVNNESSEIIRMFNSAFEVQAPRAIDFYPQDLRAEIDDMNEIIYSRVNNGVYRAGFARSQAAYEHAFEGLFDTLDMLDQHLSRTRYLVGDRITEADWRLFTTLVRFDAVYYAHFKCNHRRLIDYPSLWAYTRDLYQLPGVAETVHMEHIKYHYYASHTEINPTGIVPKGPTIDFTEPHGRDLLRAEST